MKFLRFLFGLAVVLLLVAAVIVAVACLPAVQTEVVQWALGRQSAVQASVDSVWVTLGRVELTNVTLKARGATLTLPSVEATLPVVAAVRQRRVAIQSLVAQGWTLDLSGTPVANPAEAAAGVVGALLGRWSLPFDASVAGVRLEGDALVPNQWGSGAVKVHLVITGGGVGPDHDGVFTYDASTGFLDRNQAYTTFTAHGHLIVAMDSPRTVKRVELQSELAAKSGPFPDSLNAAIDLLGTRTPAGDSFTFDVRRGSRQLAHLVAAYTADTRRLAGTWHLDGRSSDAAVLAAAQPLPEFTASGDGRFETDLHFNTFQASGRLHAVVSRAGLLVPALERLGTLSLDADFDGARTVQGFRVGRLSVSLGGAHPVAVIRALQPVSYNLNTGSFDSGRPDTDWLDVTLRGLPLAWVSELTDAWTFAGGDLAGEMIVRRTKDGFSLRSQGPLTAAGVSARHGAEVVAKGLDLRLPLSADYAPDQWSAHAAPLTLSAHGAKLASFDLQASQVAGEEVPVALVARGEVDLSAWTGGGIAPAALAPWKSASGDFSMSLGGTTTIDGTLTLAGRDAGSSLTSTVHGESRGSGTLLLTLPLKIAVAGRHSDLALEGWRTLSDSGPRFDGKITGSLVIWNDVAPILAAAASLFGAQVSAAPATKGTPFWGEDVGRLSVNVDQVNAGDREFDHVQGVIDFGPRAIRVDQGRVGFENKDLAKAVAVTASLLFDPALPVPYRLSLSASRDKLPAAPFFGKKEHADDAPVDGRFHAALKVSSDGRSLSELRDRTEIEYQLSSSDTILHLLSTSIADTIPESKTTVGQRAGQVGSFFGSLVGVHGSGKYGDNHVAKKADAVIEITNQLGEIGCDQVDVTAVESPDKAIKLRAIRVLASDERITGTGHSDPAPGRPSSERPIHLSLQLWVKGRLAQLFRTAGLLSTPKDKDGYVLVSAPIDIAGTVGRPDLTQWKQVLAKAAAP